MLLYFFLSAAGFFTACSRADSTKACEAKYCINLCCPHGYSMKSSIQRPKDHHRCDSNEEQEWICQKHSEEDLKWNGRWWNGDIIYSNFTDDNFYGSNFECTGSKKEVLADELFGEHDLKLDINGNHTFLFGNDTHQVDSADLCLGFLEYQTYSPKGKMESSIQPMFIVCHSTKEEEKSQSLFYAVIIFLSSFFTFLTFLVYLVVEDLRKNLFGKMMIGFLSNITIFYFFNGIDLILFQNKMSFVNTDICISLAYIKYYTFIAFFFWMNIMAINIAYKFYHLLTSKADGNILYSIIYAQGIPLFISFVVAFIDNFAPCDSVVLPNMGRFSCFVGSEYDGSSSFTETANFYYFYLIILIIVIVNFLCFFITGYILTNNWSSVQNMNSNSDDCLLTHVTLVLKIFFLMGIPWVLDIISAALAHSRGYSATIFSQFILDIINLLTGILLFVILICKRSVIEILRGKVRTLSLTETFELNEGQQGQS